MAAFAPPARRGDFIYSSVLQADPGNSIPHPRASVAELAALLRPEAPNLYSKGRKPDFSTPAKDQPWHFYAAQLIHYGLPITKDKSRAKLKLLDAMNQFKLEVPAWVLKLEGELRNEWDAENRKMRKGAGGGKLGKGANGYQDGGKAKTQSAQDVGAGVNVTVNLSLSSGFPSLGSAALQQPSQPTPTKPTSTKRKRVDNDMPPRISTPKKAPRLKTETTPSKRVDKNAAPRLKKEPYHSSQTSPPSRPRIKQEYAYPPHHYPSTPSPNIKPDPNATPNATPAPILLSGTYDISCPTASSLFFPSDLTLTLSKDPARSIWWATCRWGAWDMIMQLNPGPSSVALGEPCPLGWRMRDLETGALTFGKRCTGEMSFSADGRMSGWLGEVVGVGVVEFEGWRMEGCEEGLEDDLRGEWDGFVREAYGR